MSETSTLIGYGGRTIGREELALVPTPVATETHRPVPHHEIVQALVETLGFRHIGVVHDEYAVSPDGMKAFGVLDLETEMAGCRFSIGLRNSHDKSMRLAMTCGYRVFVCSNMAFAGDFTPVLAKHSKSFSLIDCISVGVDRMQRNFEPMRKQVEAWQRSELTGCHRVLRHCRERSGTAAGPQAFWRMTGSTTTRAGTGSHMHLNP